MIHAVDDKLRAEARRFRLLFACPECVSFDPEGPRCSQGYPHEPHEDDGLEDRAEVIFCKAFELR
jgi:hypothetical protein